MSSLYVPDGGQQLQGGMPYDQVTMQAMAAAEAQQRAQMPSKKQQFGMFVLDKLVNAAMAPDCTFNFATGKELMDAVDYAVKILSNL